jgi:LDH2 family malate/lactate/ureidoglycolate dehydrogenase
MPVYEDPVDARLLDTGALQAWTADVVRRMGTPQDIADDVAEVLVASDRRGIASHGTARLTQYVALVEAGVMDPVARPVTIRERPALVLMSAQNGWGHHACRVAVDLAIERARDTGTATVVVRRSNHYGIAGWYALRAAAQGFIGISLTNSSPLVAPTRSRQPLLGTNPIAVAAPAGRFGAFCLDMATSTVPRGRIEVAARRGWTLPVGWAIDADGNAATTAEAALEGSLHPLGGEEQTGGYKGYGLAMVVELLTGILGGAAFGPNVVSLFSTHEGPADLGETFVVIDPAALDDAPGGFERRLETLLEQLVQAPVAPGAPGPVLVHGAPEAEAERRADARGIAVDGEHYRSLVGLGDRLGVPVPSTLLRSSEGVGA